MNKRRLLRAAALISIITIHVSCLVPPGTDEVENVVETEKESFPVPFEGEKYSIPADFDFEGTVARWYGFREAAASLTFDDGTYDQYATAWPILEDLKVKGTFYLAADLIGRGKWDDKGTLRRMMTWKDALEIADSGHEIGSHSMSHTDLSRGEIDMEWEFRHSRDLIESKLPGTKVETFCWPHWRETDETVEAASRYYISARSGNGIISYYYDRKGGIPSDPPENMFSVNALGILKEHSPMEWKAVAEDIFKTGSWFVTSFHGIESPDAKSDELGWSALSEADFRSAVIYIQNRGFWVDTFAAVTKYIYERDASILHIKNKSTSLVLTLDDGLDDSVYDKPLSVSLKLPENWENAVAYDERGSILDSEVNEGRLFLDLYPRGDRVIIKPY